MSTIRLRWNRDAGGFVDRYGRNAARCRAEAQAATALADATRRVVDAIDAGRITLGREAGPKLIGRFLFNAEVLEAISERDRKHAAELERAEAGERAKLDANDALRAERLRRVAGRVVGADAGVETQVVDAEALPAAAGASGERPAAPALPLVASVEMWLRNVGWSQPLAALDVEIAERGRRRGQSLTDEDRSRLVALWHELQPSSAGGTGGAP